MYKESFVPPNHPGGGGFSVLKFTLSNLYSMHDYCTNWWTESNKDLPLCRYLGCKIKCYQSLLVDYIVKYTNNSQAVSNKLTYPSMQPSMIMMSNNKRIIPSKKTVQRKKPYYTLHIKPPKTLQNKWYFQKDFKDIPLLVLYISTASLNQYYIRTEADNNNINIKSINTKVIRNHNFTMNPWPYKHEGTTTLYLYMYTGAQHIKQISTLSEIQCQDLIPLTNIINFTDGSSAREAKHNWQVPHTTYCQTIGKYTGNPFMYDHLKFPENYLYSKTGPNTFAEKFKSLTQEAKVNQIMDGTQSMALTQLNELLIETYRYNPFRDDGKNTRIYLLKCSDQIPGWDPPSNHDIILEGFPLWLAIWGYVDFQIKLGAYQNIKTNTMLVIQTDKTEPKTNIPIVPIDNDYISNKSPYQQDVNPLDAKKWYPQVQYQEQTINSIAQTGPGTTKLYDKTSDQVVIKYDFLFKWGGEPAKMINVNNPSKQPSYPIPSDEYKTNSLQSPAQAIESNLYSFDQRYNTLTTAALERITKDWDITNLLSTITETTQELPAIGTFPQETQETQTEKKEKEKILQQLIQHKQQQQQLRLGILKLMKELDL